MAAAQRQQHLRRPRRVAHPTVRHPGVVDLDGLAGSMLTPQPRRLVRPLPGAKAGDELGVAVALGGLVAVLPPQLLPSRATS